MKQSIADTARLGDNYAKVLLIKDQTFRHYNIRDLPSLIPADSLVVINNAATLPGMFHGSIRGKSVELRLIRNLGFETGDISRWRGILYEGGSWMDKTENRNIPTYVRQGDEFKIQEFTGIIRQMDKPYSGLVDIEFQGSKTSIWNNIYRFGKPIQYSHLKEELELWDVQTIFANQPVAIEPPSAAFQLTWDIIHQLIQRGIEITDITHATSISSTGIEEIDKNLPLPEHYIINDSAAELLNRFYNQNKPIIAVGTSVVRALEDNFSRFSKILPGTYQTYLRIDEYYQRKLVNGLLTGLHFPEDSHMDLLRNFVSEDLLHVAYTDAQHRDYLWHEYGDLNLIL